MIVREWQETAMGGDNSSRGWNKLNDVPPKRHGGRVWPPLPPPPKGHGGRIIVVKMVVVAYILL